MWGKGAIVILCNCDTTLIGFSQTSTLCIPVPQYYVLVLSRLRVTPTPTPSKINVKFCQPKSNSMSTCIDNNRTWGTCEEGNLPSHVVHADILENDKTKLTGESGTAFSLSLHPHHLPFLLFPPPGTSVIQVTATDADDSMYGNSAKLVYSISQGHPYFSVDPNTGSRLHRMTLLKDIYFAACYQEDPGIEPPRK